MWTSWLIRGSSPCISLHFTAESKRHKTRSPRTRLIKSLTQWVSSKSMYLPCSVGRPSLSDICRDAYMNSPSQVFRRVTEQQNNLHQMRIWCKHISWVIWQTTNRFQWNSCFLPLFIPDIGLTFDIWSSTLLLFLYLVGLGLGFLFLFQGLRLFVMLQNYLLEQFLSFH